jgi:hypothetical protein
MNFLCCRWIWSGSSPEVWCVQGLLHGWTGGTRGTRPAALPGLGRSVPRWVLVGGFKHFLFSTIYGIIMDNPSHWLILSKYFSEGFKPPTRVLCLPSQNGSCLLSNYDNYVFSTWFYMIFPLDVNPARTFLELGLGTRPLPDGSAMIAYRREPGWTFLPRSLAKMWNDGALQVILAASNWGLFVWIALDLGRRLSTVFPSPEDFSHLLGPRWSQICGNPLLNHGFWTTLARCRSLAQYSSKVQSYEIQQVVFAISKSVCKKDPQ